MKDVKHLVDNALKNFSEQREKFSEIDVAQALSVATKGFDRGARRVHSGVLGAILLLSLSAAFLLGGTGAILPLLAAALACLLSILYAKGQLGGMSGDVAGYGTVLGEAAALAAMLL